MSNIYQVMAAYNRQLAAEELPQAYRAPHIELYELVF